MGRVIYVLSLLDRNALLLEHESVFERHFFEGIETPRFSAMAASFEHDFVNQRVAVELGGTQLGGVLGRLPVGHLAIIEGREHEDGRVVRRMNILVRRISANVVVVGLDLRIAPLFELGHGERQSFVEHGVNDVNERHVDDGGLEQVRAQIEHCSHQQAASTATFDAELIGRGITLGDQVLGAGDEVGEGVHLLLQLAVITPSFAHVAAATNVSDGIDIAAVEQTDSSAAEAGGDGDAVRAVGVEVALATFRQFTLVDQGDGHNGAIRCGGEDTFAAVSSEIVALHLLTLEHGGAAAFEVVLESRRRRHHRVVGEAIDTGIELVVGGARNGIGRLGKVDVVNVAAGELLDANLAEALVFLEDDQVISEDVDTFDFDAGSMSENFRPLAGRAVRSLEQAEVFGLLIGEDVEVLAVIVDLVGDHVLPRQNLLELRERLVGPNVGRESGGVAGSVEVDESSRASLGDVHAEELIGLFVNQNMPLVADLVAIEAVGALGDSVFARVEERLVVLGPDHRSDAFGGGIEHLTREQVLHHQGVLAKALVVVGVGDEVAAGADGDRAELEEGAAFRQDVDVEDDLLRAALLEATTAREAVLFALFGAAVIQPTTATGRHRLVALFDTRTHLEIELLLQGLGVSHVGERVGVLGFEVGNQIWVLHRQIAHPGIVIDHVMAMKRHHVGHLFGDRRSDQRKGTEVGS